MIIQKLNSNSKSYQHSKRKFHIFVLIGVNFLKRIYADSKALNGHLEYIRYLYLNRSKTKAVLYKHFYFSNP